jgi:hypothetical protein
MLPALIAALTAVAVAAVPAAADRSKHISHVVVIYESSSRRSIKPMGLI